MQGYGPFLMAGAEVTTMLRSFDIERKLNTLHYRARKRSPARNARRGGVS
jgi:hypothetical protein